jgi:hypothetical protein
LSDSSFELLVQGLNKQHGIFGGLITYALSEKVNIQIRKIKINSGDIWLEINRASKLMIWG